MLYDCDGPDCDGCGDSCDWPTSEKRRRKREEKRRRKMNAKHVHIVDELPPHPDQQRRRYEGRIRRGLRAVSLATVPARTARTMRWWSPRRAGMAAIGAYQRHISPRMPHVRCRYTPSCSHYGMAAVREYGLLRGSRLALGRIMRCNRAVPRGTKDPLRTDIGLSRPQPARVR